MINAPAASRARGSVRLGATISPASSGATSSPANAKAREDHRVSSLSPACGRQAAGSSAMAGPPRTHATAPTAISIATGIQVPTAPALCSHLPTLSPTRCRAKAIAIPPRVTEMK